jgi:serine/threonine protein kinase
MASQRWKQVEEIFHAALKLETEDRSAFLQQACAGDKTLLRDVENLLAQESDAASFLQTPAINVAANLMTDGVAELVGQTISHYKILRKLGAGGMGVVYEAEDLKLKRRVAIKFLPHDVLQNTVAIERFKREAHAASALNHPNILTIHELGEAEGHHFIAAELVDGKTVRERLKRDGNMKTNDVLRFATQIASALAAAHNAGIIHRDIKPENIMIRRDGYVKVLDFGLAKLTETIAAQQKETGTLANSSIAPTESGIVLGTAQYMSPEQAMGKKVDDRSDIFSFGVVLYEMLTGQRVFQGNSVAEILAALLNQEPKPLPSSLSPDLAKIILRCLRKDPSRRYQTMADLKVALEDLLVETSPSNQLVINQTQRGMRFFLALVILAILVFGFYALRTKPLQESFRIESITTLPGAEEFPSLSPDGNHVAFAWSGLKQDNQDIYVQMIGQGSPLRLTTDAYDDYNPVWSPDGRWIAFLRSQSRGTTGLQKRELILIAPLGGPERKLIEINSQDFNRSSPYLAWSSESKSLFVTDSPGVGRPDALYVVSLETGERRQLTTPQPPVLADTSPAVSPDGRSLVFLRRSSWGSGELHLLALKNGNVAMEPSRRLTSAELDADYPAWMANSKEIIFSAQGRLWRLSTARNSQPLRISNIGEDALMPTLTRSDSRKPDRLVYVRSSSDDNIWRVETSTAGAPSSSPPVVAISSTKPDFHCEFSPDGSKVAFVSNRSGEFEIWISNPDGTNAMKLTSMGVPDITWPHWSPDGQLIAFSSASEGEWDIFAIPASGGKPRRLTSHPAIDIHPTFSRDGKWIYFASMRSGDYRIWKMSVNGGEAVRVTPNQGRGALESPDGKSIYYHSVSVFAPLWRLPISGNAPPEKVLDQIVWYNYCLVDRGIYYIDQIGKETRIQFYDFITKTTTTVANNVGNVSPGMTATADGKTILFSRVDSSTDDLMLVENFK